MDVDLAGMIRSGSAKGPTLLPVFEAITNAIHAAEDRDVTPRIEIVLHRQPGLVTDDETALDPVESVTIRDNGAGFNDKNYRSFDTLYSQLRADKGGKGLGRVTFLERFQAVEITSQYFEDGRWYRRTFKFFTPTEPPLHGAPRLASMTPLGIRA